MRNLKTVNRLLSCACLMLFAAALAQAKEWRGIVPLHSTRADVERLIGKPIRGNNQYRIGTELATISYSVVGGCKIESKNAWDVPRETVLRIIVTPKVNIRLSDLRIDLQKYKKVKDPEITVHTHYKNEVEGISYVVFEGGGEDNGLILTTEYEPAAKDDNLRCRCWS